MRRSWTSWLLLTSIASACGDHETPAAHFGQALFRTHKLSTSPVNAFACSTCHSVGGPAADRIDAGYDLANTVYRQSWWGGYETRLLDAINFCLQSFMGAEPLHPESPEARQLYEYLLDNSPDTAAAPLPLTVVKTATGLPQLMGDATMGAATFKAACRICHGEPHTGSGALTKAASVIPEDTMKTFGAMARAVAEEKVRHGKFFNIGGFMPPYSVEAMTDQQVADILAYLGL